ncbi:Innexin [Aphelenchoides besseyi]|nr:Innexin [Aphelenchoides besseyi]KAI6207646.1 Innexin [Aphelenchoides besseyi]
MLGIPFLDDAVNKLFKPQSFDDPIDRLNYFMTSTLLTFFALMVSAKQYVGAPIQCWMPMEFKGGWEQYAEDYCFIQNTYYVEPENEIPTKIEDRDEKQFGYYQWVPVVLAIQAFMFFLPNWIWKTMHQQSGIDLGTAVSDAQKLRSMPSQDRRDEIEKLSNYVSECLEINQQVPTPRRIMFVRFGRSLGSYVSCLYIFIKLLYVVNIIGQFYLLNSFIGRDYHLWGWTALTSLWTGNEWTDSPVFPRVSLCDFRIRRLANFHRYTVQCVLMINMFNEKIYLFIWFWFLFVGISTIINFFYVLATLLPERQRRGTLYQLLKTEEMQDLLKDSETRRCLDEFVRAGLRPDGILLLRFVEGHAGAIVARDLSTKLFKDYLENLPSFSKQLYHQSTKSTSPGIDDHYTREPLNSHQFNEKLDDVDSGFGKPKYV